MRKLLDLIEEEYHQLSLWYFVAFIFGIVSFYTSKHHLPFLLIAGSILVLAVFAWRVRDRSTSFYFLLMSICLFSMGVLVAQIRAGNINTPILKQMKTLTIEGEVVSTKPSRNGSVLFIRDIEADELPDGIEVKLNIKREQMTPIAIGDRISLKARLFPLQPAMLPGSYDFGFYQYMQGVGASGYALSAPVKLHDKGSMSGVQAYIEDIRASVYQRIIHVLGERTGNFIAAILIGQTSGIDQETSDNMRSSGVSHILSVSGLHLTQVAMLFFFLGRFGLNLIGPIAYHYDVKKIAGVISIVASFAYLLLSGTKIAATRAFIMTTIFIFGTILGRSPHPMRSIFVAAFLILAVSPEYVLHPSFQLSFAAVLCLVSGYEFYLRNQSIFGEYTGALASVKFYLLANIYSSLLASIATAPFVIYHFYKFANYSVLMNLVAIPLMSFGIMPFGIAALFLMIVGLDYYLLQLIGYLAEMITGAASWVVTLPGAVWHFGHIQQSSLGIFVFGFFWLCIWQTRLRFFGFIPVIASCILMLNTPRPDFIYDAHYNNVGLKSADEGLTIYYDKRLPDFTKSYWLSWWGIEETNVEINQRKINKQDLLFELASGRTLSLSYNKCVKSDFMIVTSRRLSCKEERGSQLLVLSSLNGLKSLAVYCDENECKYEVSQRGQ